MATNPQVENDVYDRYGVKWADFPSMITPSAHSDEAELFCAKQAMAVYGVYPNAPHAPQNDYIPSRNRGAIQARTFSVERMIEGGADLPTDSLEAEQGYRVILADKAGALMVWKQDNLVVSFRGTANWQDWIHNFASAGIRTDLAKVSDELELHKGFTGLAENLAPAVRELIIEFLKTRSRRAPTPTLTLCGHSLGGALALNFAARMQHWMERRHWDSWHHLDHDTPLRMGATYTFGAPRIGKGQVWQYIRRPHYRLIIRGDPIPKTPPLCTDDYEAVYLEKPSVPPRQPKNTFKKIKAALSTKLLPFDVNAHDIENYIEAIQQKIAAKSGT